MKRLVALILCLFTLFSTASAVEDGFIVRNGSREEKRICITVDDCLDIPVLQEIFDLSQELDAPMTFFTLGFMITEENKALWQAIAASDSEIGNHCYYHGRMPEMKTGRITRNLDRTEEALDAVLGYHYPMQVMRPPYGRLSDEDTPLRIVLNEIDAAGYNHAVLWDVSQTDPEECLKDVQNGSILLFHTLQKDLRCLKELIPQLQAQGYEFVTVSEMLGLPAIELPPEATAAEQQ